MPDVQRTLFSDFDGTLTNVDFFELVLREMQPELEGDPIGAFYAGELPLFETLRRIFAAIPLAEAEVVTLLPKLEPDPHLAEDFARLHAAGWELHVISAGSDWYIEETLRRVGVDVPVSIHANPGRFEPGRGLVMERPADPRLARDDIGIDKAAVVRLYSKIGGTVAFAGNSGPDLAAARVVDEPLRFARGSLQQALDAEGLEYQRFERWHEVAEALLAR